MVLFSRENIASLSSAESAHSMIIKVKVFNDCGQTRNTAPDEFFLS